MNALQHNHNHRINVLGLVMVHLIDQSRVNLHMINVLGLVMVHLIDQSRVNLHMIIMFPIYVRLEKAC